MSSISYHYIPANEPNKHKRILPANVIENIDLRSEFFVEKKFYISLLRFASYALQFRNYSVLVAEKDKEDCRSGSTAYSKPSLGHLDLHGYHIGTPGSPYSENFALKRWMKESEAITFWAQAEEVGRAIANNYVKDELVRASSNRFLLKHLLSRF